MLTRFSSEMLSWVRKRRIQVYERLSETLNVSDIQRAIWLIVISSAPKISALRSGLGFDIDEPQK